MIFAEPNTTPYDWNFNIAGIPVRVSPWFWLVALFLGASGANPDRMAQEIIFWVAVVFVSILVHELGHALTARAFGFTPHIVLHGMGGLAIYRPTYYRPATQLMIAAAGPLAGFVLAGLIIVLLIVIGAGVRVPIIGIEIPSTNVLENGAARIVVAYLLFINIIWGLVNLVPVFPLDGGQISRELFMMLAPDRAIERSLKLSVATGAALAVYSLVALQSVFLPMLLGALTYQNYQMLQSHSGGGRRW